MSYRNWNVHHARVRDLEVQDIADGLGEASQEDHGLPFAIVLEVLDTVKLHPDTHRDIIDAFRSNPTLAAFIERAQQG